MVGLLGLVAGDGDPPCLRRDDDLLGGHHDLRREGLGLSYEHLQILDYEGSEPGQLEAECVEAGIDSAQNILTDI